MMSKERRCICTVLAVCFFIVVPYLPGSMSSCFAGEGDIGRESPAKTNSDGCPVLLFVFDMDYMVVNYDQVCHLLGIMVKMNESGQDKQKKTVQIV
ncbi:hypothetical protein CI610_01070 [invertebrate metagenome]|uniref:Uncharacterized protein n=1 Tax=invertebrate metagenome TaxID=1711999 RepID=A0A2H9T9R9_9ZZZZ